MNEETQKIKGRYNSFGIWTRQTKSEVKNDEFDEELPYSPQIVALSFLIKACFNYPTNWTLDVDEVVYWCTYFLNNFAEYSNPKIIKRKTLSINTFMYGTDNCKRAKTLITGKPISIPNRRVLNRQRRIQLFENMCLEKLGTNKATKYQLCEIVKFIRDNDDECDFNPNKKQKKMKFLIGSLIILINISLLSIHIKKKNIYIIHNMNYILLMVFNLISYK